MGEANHIPSPTPSPTASTDSGTAPLGVDGDDDARNSGVENEAHSDAYTGSPSNVSLGSSYTGSSPSIATQKEPSNTAADGKPQPRINKNDAMVYLEQVRSQFLDQPEIYGKFLDIMKDFKAHAITTDLVIERVTYLFRGYPHLVEGFNAFIPEEHRFRMSSATKYTSSGKSPSSPSTGSAILGQASYHHSRPALPPGYNPSGPIQPQSSSTARVTKYLSAGPTPPALTSSSEYQIEKILPSHFGYGPSSTAHPHTYYGPSGSASSGYSQPYGGSLNHSSSATYPLSSASASGNGGGPSSSAYASSSAASPYGHHHPHLHLSHLPSHPSSCSYSPSASAPTYPLSGSSQPPSSGSAPWNNNPNSYNNTADRAPFGEKNIMYDRPPPHPYSNGAERSYQGERTSSTSASYDRHYHQGYALPERYFVQNSGDQRQSSSYGPSTSSTSPPYSNAYGGAPYPHHSQSGPSAVPSSYVSHPHYSSSSVSSSGSQSSTLTIEKESGERKSSMGMLQAVGYLKKIQDRFYGHPEVYQSFVEILRSYQREQRPIREVYAQVASLFSGHSDLLDEFAQFIPDAQSVGISGLAPAPPPAKPVVQTRKQGHHPQNPPIGGYPGGGSGVSSSSSSSGSVSGSVSGTGSIGGNGSVGSSAGTYSNSAPIPAPAYHPSSSSEPIFGPQPTFDSYARPTAVNQRRRLSSSQYPMPPSTTPSLAAAKRARIGPLLGAFPGTSPVTSAPNVPAGSMAATTTPSPTSFQSSSTQYAAETTPPIPYALMDVQKPQASSSLSPVDVSSLPEGDFFSKVRKFLNDHEGAYSEFVKCLDFYTHRIVGKSELMKLVRPFIGRSPELLSKFSQILGLSDEGGPDETENRYLRDDEPIAIPIDVDGTADPDANVAPRRLGSYRMLSEARGGSAVTSSGRTPLCMEVLNDLMVSCPSFNSEDSTFVASRKNASEEALFRCEDERYELDLLIDGARSAIAWFELERLSLSAASKSKVASPKLSVQPPPIHRALIGRVWGDQASSILKALHQLPVTAIPLLITRLTQKLEEWRIIFRELSQNQWLEIHVKNVQKALDHQGTTFRTVDRKSLSLRALTNEIHSIFLEQMKRGTRASASISVSSLPSFGSADNLNDSKTAANNASTKGPMELAQLDWELSSPLVARTLCSLLLARESTVDSNGLKKRAAIGQFLTIFLPQFFANSVTCSTMLYANESLYLFFRLFQIAYCRLERILVLSHKACTSTTPQHPLASLFAASSAIDHAATHNLSAPGGHTADSGARPYALAIDRAPAAGENHSSNDLFETCVKIMEDFISGAIDGSSFEERLRQVLGPNAYLLFTFDRLLSLISKQAALLLADPVVERLVSIFETHGVHKNHHANGIPETDEHDRGKRLAIGVILSATPSSVMAANSSANKSSFLPMQPFLFSIEAIGRLKSPQIDANDSCIPGIFLEGHEWLVRFRVIPAPIGTALPDDQHHHYHSFSSCKGSNLEKWSSYIDRFVDPQYDHRVLKPPGCSAPRKAPLILERNLKKIASSQPAVPNVSYRLEMKIDVPSFRIFFVPGTEDCVFSKKACGLAVHNTY
ncbi:Paired amphipathic helix protein Sin3a [Mitosporidium daphniae]|uniref:Histone deacetylase interacting domain-containing protein n=1 Tax=Mitosporidium daphniae TaxID=1485682 RepID=A0A098VV13_9MICR|nr:uncharacterized protein DI09_31p70 [Mitosporidium daphniae]KGG51556.1 hypothetical protein DI09_31p70 [Mitosporidium daphniae]|eukprot:XP_013238009.1 uncharacterized protein DI09_31p70 [Mitosporidium daphniae]